MRAYTYYKNALKNIPKPCLFLDNDMFRTNIRNILSASNNKNIRIASKSIRSVPVLKEILNASSTFQGIMCYAADEAIYLNDNGLDDLLIAYPVWNTKYLKAIASRVMNKQTITVMVDSIEHIEHLEMVAAENNHQFLVCLDIDLSSEYPGLHFGVHRSPVKTVSHAVALINRIEDSPYMKLDGIMGYEAQIAGVTDNNPKQRMKNMVVRFLKNHSSKALKKKRQEIIDIIHEKQIDLRFINGGGTGSLHQTTKENVTEITVGSGFFNSRLFDFYRDYSNLPALAYAIEITRIPKKHIYTCAGGGYIASGAMGKDRMPHIYLPEGACLTANEGAGEVQTPIYYDGDIPLKHGDPIFLRHSKAGELCEHFHHIHLIKDGKIIDTYKTYRGDYQCFL